MYKYLAIVGPSGVGKTSLMHNLINKYPSKFVKVEQCTTRDIRDNEDWDINAFHVKGHTKNEDYYSIMNDKCDKLAVAKIKEMKEERGIE